MGDRVGEAGQVLVRRNEVGASFRLRGGDAELALLGDVAGDGGSANHGPVLVVERETETDTGKTVPSLRCRMVS